MSIHYAGGIRFSPYPRRTPPNHLHFKLEPEPANNPLVVPDPGDDDFPTIIPHPHQNPRLYTFLPPSSIPDPIDFGIPLPGYRCGGRVFASHLHTRRVYKHYKENYACLTKVERDAYAYIYSNKLDDEGYQLVTDACTPNFVASHFIPQPHRHYNHTPQADLLSTFRYICRWPGTFTRKLHFHDPHIVIHVRDDNLTFLDLQAIGHFVHHIPERHMLEEGTHYPWNSTYIEEIREELVDVVDLDHNYIQLPISTDYYSLDYTTFPLYHKGTGRLICRDPNGFEVAAQKLIDERGDAYLLVSRGIRGFADLVSEQANMFFIDGERHSELMFTDIMNHHHGRFARCSHCGHDDGGHDDGQVGH